MAGKSEQRIGRYELIEELGRGGMARVYRARDTQLQRIVALKVLAAQLSMDAEFIKRFEREARTAANLRHPHIVTVYDIGEDQGLHYIAMEYIDGRPLHAILEQYGSLGLKYAIAILEPIALALDYAHQVGAVHRDVKPHNILIDRNGRVVLTDFGIAQTPEADEQRLTRTGVFMGTPEYISPEQAEARRVDGRSDLYSLAVVAYEIIAGRVPFSGATPQLIVAHAQLPPPPITSFAPDLPTDLDLVLTRALAKRPERRFQTGAAFIAALRDIAERNGVVPAPTVELVALFNPSLPTAPGLIQHSSVPKPVSPSLPSATPAVSRPPKQPDLSVAHHNHPATPEPPASAVPRRHEPEPGVA
ncbi:serine/threonine-protein kinase, partial [Chloroflexus sp.]|uniref:serine/threonine-protein kinase n=1 Tax=Chloroflexus sp. TaxID=1904827 RepID=UPI002ADDB672